MDEILTLKEFTQRYKISRAMAIGFKSHLRIEDDTRMSLGEFLNAYFECWGVTLHESNGGQASLPVEPIGDNASKPEISIPVGAHVEINMTTGETKVKSEEDANIKRRK